MGKSSYTNIKIGSKVRILNTEANRKSNYAEHIGRVAIVEDLDGEEGRIKTDTPVYLKGGPGMFAFRLEVLGPKSFVNK